MSNAAAAEATPMRFSIRSLLMVVTVVCVLLAPYPWLGLFYLYSVVLSAALVVCSVLSYTNKWTTSPTRLSVYGILSGFLGVGSLVFIVHSLLNLVGSIYAKSNQLHPHTFATVLVLLAVLPYAFAVTRGVRDFRRVSALRQEYPIESLETRLEFEINRSQTIALRNAAIPQMSSLVDTNLTKLEQHFEGDFPYRAMALSRLHDETYHRFAAAEGFGPARMPVFANSIQSTQLEYSRDKLNLPLSLKDFDSFPRGTATIHQEVLQDFFEPDSYGEVRSANLAIGFEAHGPAQLPEKIGVQNTATWQLTRLELVSLFRHDEPRMYVAETIPLRGGGATAACHRARHGDRRIARWCRNARRRSRW